MGVFVLIKSILPAILYGTSLLMILSALIGKTRWPLLCVTFVLPLRNIIEKLQDFPGGTKLLSVLVLAILIGTVLTNLTKKTKSIEPLPLAGTIAAVVVYMFISLQIGNVALGGGSFFDISDSRVQDWKNFCLFPLLYFVTFKTVQDEKWVWRIILTMCLAMVVMNYYTVNQTLWYSSLVSRAKINGTFQYLGPNEVAAFYAQYSLLLLSVLFFLKDKKLKLLLLGLILVNVYCLAFMYSRGAYLGFTLGLLVLFLIKRRRYLIPLFLGAVLWQTVLPQSVVERIQETSQRGQLEQSAAERLDLWAVSIDLFQKQPVFGIGYGVFRHLKFRGLEDTHNIYVKYLVEQGLIGLFLFLAILFGFIRQGFILFRKEGSELNKGLGLGLVVAVTGLMGNNFFGDRWTYLEVSGYIWIIAALVARLNTMKAAVPMAQNIKIKAPAGKKHQKKVRYYDL